MAELGLSALESLKTSAAEYLVFPEEWRTMDEAGSIEPYESALISAHGFPQLGLRTPMIVRGHSETQIVTASAMRTTAVDARQTL